MKRPITLQEALEIIEAIDGDGDCIPFSIVFTTCDMNRGTGGERVHMPHAVLATARKAKPEQSGSEGRAATSRRPGHWRNYTRNIRPVGSGDIKTIHPLLIDSINDQRVIL